MKSDVVCSLSTFRKPWGFIMKKNVNFLGQVFFWVCTVCTTSAYSMGKVAFNIELNPAGDFTAKSIFLKGSVVQQGDLYIAEGISLDLETLSTGIEMRDFHMKETYFETQKSPANKSAMILNVKAESGIFKAALKIRDIVQDVEGTYQVNSNKLTANFKTSLSAFQIKKASYMGVGVVDEVNVTAEIPIKMTTEN